MANSALRIDERPELPTYYEPDAEPALQVRAVFNGVLIGTRLLPENGAPRRHGLAPKANYMIGQSPSADAPAATELLGATDLQLVTRWGDSFLVSVTPKMSGDVSVGGKVYRLADYVAGRGTNFTLPLDAKARITCGAMSFGLEHTTAAKRVPRRWFTWDWQEQKFTVGSVAAVLLVLLLSFAAPPDEATASNDLIGMSRTLLPFTIMPAAPEKVPEIVAAKADARPGEAGQAHAGPSGKAGDPKSQRPAGRLAVAGNGIDMQVGKAKAEAAARTAGILGILSANTSPFASIFGRETAVGDAAENILGNLVGDQVANGWGPGGLGAVGTGAGGGGFGERSLGTGRFGTLGHGGTGHGGYGTGVGALARHVPRTPVITQGIAHVRGSLDKEIIRRIVRLHMNEVKYCYDKELAIKPALEGRVSVQFVISPVGQVLSSVLQSTTMGNVRVERCVVEAIRRWDFPKPIGGGIAIVSYPFSFVAGSGV
jgi:TonB family protein